MKVRRDGVLEAQPVTQATTPWTVDGEVTAQQGGAPWSVTFAADQLRNRMLAFTAAAGYNLWFDTDDTDYVYVLEAVAGAVSTDAGFRGIRLPLSDVGGVVGPVEVNVDAGLTFDTRKTDGNWA